MRTMVRVMADIRAAQADLRRWEGAPEGTPEAEQHRLTAERLEKLWEEWRAVSAAPGSATDSASDSEGADA
jgi:hypothetical protein